MCRNFLSLSAARLTVVLLALLSFAPTGVAQLLPASPPIADPMDTRFVGVTEDWTQLALTTSHLRAVPPLFAYRNVYPNYTVELLQVQWRWGDPLDLYVIKPAGVTKPPVILYLYGYPTDTDPFKNEKWQRAVTKDGFAAVGFVSALTGHRYHDRPMKDWFLSELQECLAVSAHDVQMVLNYLSTRGDLDMDRVGMFTEGSGASIGILASAADPRIKVLDAVNPWGDWPVWMAKSPFVPEDERADYVTPLFLGKAAMLDPLGWLPKIKARKFRLQDATFEANTPKEAKEALRAAVPPGASVVLYHTPHEFNMAMIHNQEMDWMHSELRALGEPAAPRTAALEKP